MDLIFSTTTACLAVGDHHIKMSHFLGASTMKEKWIWEAAKLCEKLIQRCEIDENELFVHQIGVRNTAKHSN